jgi:hypothetical protein
MDDPSGLSVSLVRVLVWLWLGPRVSDEAVEQIQQSRSNSVGLVFFERESGRAAAIARCGDESREEAEDDLHTI